MGTAGQLWELDWARVGQADRGVGGWGLAGRVDRSPWVDDHLSSIMMHSLFQLN